MGRPEEMVVIRGVRYRREDAEALGLEAETEPAPDVAALEAEVEAQRIAAEEQAAAEKADAERLAAEDQAAAEKARTPANKGRTAPTKGQ